MLHLHGLQAEEYAKHQAAYLRQVAAQERVVNSLPGTTLSARIANGMVRMGLWLERCGRCYVDRAKHTVPARDALFEELQLSR